MPHFANGALAECTNTRTCMAERPWLLLPLRRPQFNSMRSRQMPNPRSIHSLDTQTVPFVAGVGSDQARAVGDVGEAHQAWSFDRGVITRQAIRSSMNWLFSYRSTVSNPNNRQHLPCDCKPHGAVQIPLFCLEFSDWCT